MRDLIWPATFCALGAAACDPQPARPPCKVDEVRIADRCLPAGGESSGATEDVQDTSPDAVSPAEVVATEVVDAASPDGEPGDSGASDAGEPALPFVVDGRFVMSGFMGSGSVSVAPCGEAEPADTGPGPCRAITWRPAAGTTADWVGFYYQYPENNWGDAPGYPIPPGASAVTFRAWGAAGGESANFAAGIEAADGFQRETGYQRLTTAPQTWSLSLAGASYSDVAGAFAWFLDNPTATSEVRFFLDDVAWVAAPPEPACAGAACKTAVTFEVDMGCPDPERAFSSVWVTGPFCQWCAEGFPLTDPDGDGRFSGTFQFARGALEFKFMVDGFASQEDLLDDAAGGCAPVTDGASYANRRVTVGEAAMTVSATYGRCGGCP